MSDDEVYTQVDITLAAQTPDSPGAVPGPYPAPFDDTPEPEEDDFTNETFSTAIAVSTPSLGGGGSGGVLIGGGKEPPAGPQFNVVAMEEPRRESGFVVLVSYGDDPINSRMLDADSLESAQELARVISRNIQNGTDISGLVDAVNDALADGTLTPPDPVVMVKG
jgi:hypothetical protein